MAVVAHWFGRRADGDGRAHSHGGVNPLLRIESDMGRMLKRVLAM
jgi:hypothetical protein